MKVKCISRRRTDSPLIIGEIYESTCMDDYFTELEIFPDNYFHSSQFEKIVENIDTSFLSYRNEVLKNVAGHLSEDQWIALGAMGLCGEAGEVADVIKKHLFHGVELNREKVIKELGDVRWYFELLCHCLGTTIEEVEAANVTKLRARYPEGFTTQASIDRKDETVG